MTDHKAEPSQASLVGTPGHDASLGKMLIEARNQRGLSADDVIRQARVPAHYLKMIESDDYGLISDQLYVLPFLRRYAEFVGLDAEDVATRFIHEVQRADSNVARMSEPIAVVAPSAAGTRRTRVAAAATALAVVVVAAAYLALARHRRATPPAPPSPAAASLPAKS